MYCIYSISNSLYMHSYIKFELEMPKIISVSPKGSGQTLMMNNIQDLLAIGYLRLKASQYIMAWWILPLLIVLRWCLSRNNRREISTHPQLVISIHTRYVSYPSVYVVTNKDVTCSYNTRQILKALQVKNILDGLNK